MKKVLLYDLKLESYVYHSTPLPTMEGIVIAGYHSAIGDRVTLTDKKVDWRHYDIIYIIADTPGLAYDPAWLGDSRVVPIGVAFGNANAYDPQWERYPLNSRPYINWAEGWKLKYPKYNPERLNAFYLEPHKVMQDGRYVPPKGTVLIIDNDWHKWDHDCSLASTWDIQGAMFLYPLEMTGRERDVLEFLEKRTVRRSNLWGHLDYHYYQDPAHLANYVNAWKEFPIGRMFRQRMYITAHSEVGWRKAIIFSYNLVNDLKGPTRKRIMLKFYGDIPPKYERLLTELSRWSSAASSSSNYYSFVDFMLFEMTRSDKLAGELLADPYQYIEKGSRGTNKLKEIVPVLLEDEELLRILMKWKEGQGY